MILNILSVSNQIRVNPSITPTKTPRALLALILHRVATTVEIILARCVLWYVWQQLGASATFFGLCAPRVGGWLFLSLTTTTWFVRGNGEVRPARTHDVTLSRFDGATSIQK